MSKRIWHHPEIPANETTVSWRSVGQLEDTAVFRQWMDREFPQGAAEMSNQEEQEQSRRTFLKIMGASTALAGFGMASCRRPETYIVPYTQAPEWVIPGKATYYATSMPRALGAVPLVVTSYEGRPTKVGPNHLHPDAEGTNAFAQASILDLYSPSRSKTFLKQGGKSTYEELQKAIKVIAQNGAEKIAFIFGEDVSPTRFRLIKQLKAKFANARFYRYEALTGEAESATGKGVSLTADFTKADRILALDCDFAAMDFYGSTTAFFNRRKPEGRGYKAKANSSSMNRLYAVESAFSLTGGMADHRLRIAPSAMLMVVAEIARQFGLHDLVANVPALKDDKQLAWVQAMANDLKAEKSKSAVLVGSRQPVAIHHLALAINEQLGSIGKNKALQAYQTPLAQLETFSQFIQDANAGLIDSLVCLTPSNPSYDSPSDFEFNKVLSSIKTSIHLGLRTDATAHAATYHIPAAHYLESWNDATSASGVYTAVQPMILPLYPNCVSELELLLSFLNSEGKLVYGEGKKGEASLAYHAVRETFSATFTSSQSAWLEMLKNGFYGGALFESVQPTLNNQAKNQIVSINQNEIKGLEVIFASDASVYDGRWIDNGWLQEAPDPISKLTWDNAALIAPKTAKELGVYDHVIETEPENNVLGVNMKNAARSPDDEGEHRKAPMISIELNGKTLELPVIISFGQAENTIIIPLGYGQGFDQHDELKRGPFNASHVGLVGINRGFNAYPLRTSQTSYFATGATVNLLDKRYSVALVQEHNSMYGRALAREISTMSDSQKGDFSSQLANVQKQGNDSHAPKNLYLYKPEDRAGQPLLSDDRHQWGMSIDLSSCMGCNACLVACQSENNIPIVGKQQVARGREMHWIRMDRYFAAQKDNTFDADNPALVPQPVACVHCESAPCEVVCPVNATVHTEDGLNAMAYNRCIGTRYCANNCPYKARRFNFFDYNKRNPLIANNLYKGPFGTKQEGEAAHLQKNPNVTVRMRGVMEKCTYCVQRLKDAVIRQKKGLKQDTLVAGKLSSEMKVDAQSLRIPVDSVKTACQDACPAEAITFGNLLDDEKSALGRSKRLERNYDLLNYIGTRPRTSYLARVKNPNPKMPDAAFIGKATIHMA